MDQDPLPLPDASGIGIEHDQAVAAMKVDEQGGVLRGRA